MTPQPQRRRSRRIAPILCAAVLLSIAAAAGAALVPEGGSFRISHATAVGPDRDATDTAVAFNSAANEFLVVWEGDGLATDNEQEIFGQRVSAAGNEIGGDFRISNVGADDNAGVAAFEPAVAYDSGANQYLVVWTGENAGPNDMEVYGQLISAGGAQIPSATDFPISSIDPPGEDRGAQDVGVTYNAAAGEFLVVWSADDLATDNELEIFGQRIASSGASAGPEDFRISNVGTDGDTSPQVRTPYVAANPVTNDYLVVWSGQGTAGPSQSDVFGQLVDSDGDEIGTDFRISETADVAVDRGADVYGAAYNPVAGNYLVVWSGDALADNRFETFGQVVGPTGAEVVDDFRISNTTDLGSNHDAEDSTVASAGSEYVVAWHGDGLAGSDKREIFAQVVSNAGAQVGTDFRVSTTGTDGDTAREAFSPAVAADPATGRYALVWQANGLMSASAFEIFGRLYGPEPSPPPPPPDPEPRPEPAGSCAGKRATKTGTAGRNVIRGTGKRDVIAALGGNDVVRGLGGNDLICGGKGKDRLFGGPGRDRLLGAAGRDFLRGGPGRDQVAGGAGRDNQRQ